MFQCARVFAAMIAKATMAICEASIWRLSKTICSILFGEGAREGQLASLPEELSSDSKAKKKEQRKKRATEVEFLSPIHLLFMRLPGCLD